MNSPGERRFFILMQFNMVEKEFKGVLIWKKEDAFELTNTCLYRKGKNVIRSFSKKYFYNIAEVQ